MEQRAKPVRQKTAEQSGPRMKISLSRNKHWSQWRKKQQIKMRNPLRKREHCPQKVRLNTSRGFSNWGYPTGIRQKNIFSTSYSSNSSQLGDTQSLKAEEKGSVSTNLFITKNRRILAKSKIQGHRIHNKWLTTKQIKILSGMSKLDSQLKPKKGMNFEEKEELVSRIFKSFPTDHLQPNTVNKLKIGVRGRSEPYKNQEISQGQSMQILKNKSVNKKATFQFDVSILKKISQTIKEIGQVSIQDENQYQSQYQYSDSQQGDKQSKSKLKNSRKTKMIRKTIQKRKFMNEITQSRSKVASILDSSNRKQLVDMLGVLSSLNQDQNSSKDINQTIGTQKPDTSNSQNFNAHFRSLSSRRTSRGKNSQIQGRGREKYWKSKRSQQKQNPKLDLEFIQNTSITLKNGPSSPSMGPSSIRKSTIQDNYTKTKFKRAQVIFENTALSCMPVCYLTKPWLDRTSYRLEK